MTKLVSLRVILPADDDAAIGAVQDRLRSIIEAAGTERLPNSGDGQKRKRVAGQAELTGS